jgi:hypothetical protein
MPVTRFCVLLKYKALCTNTLLTASTRLFFKGSQNYDFLITIFSGKPEKHGLKNPRKGKSFGAY